MSGVIISNANIVQDSSGLKINQNTKIGKNCRINMGNGASTKQMEELKQSLQNAQIGENVIISCGNTEIVNTTVTPIPVKTKTTEFNQTKSTKINQTTKSETFY